MHVLLCQRISELSEEIEVVKNFIQNISLQTGKSEKTELLHQQGPNFLKENASKDTIKKQL